MKDRLSYSFLFHLFIKKEMEEIRESKGERQVSSNLSAMEFALFWLVWTKLRYLIPQILYHSPYYFVNCELFENHIFYIWNNFK